MTAGAQRTAGNGAAPVAVGLRRLIVAILAVALLFAAGTAAVIFELRYHVERLSASGAVEEARRRVDLARADLDTAPTESAAAVLAALADLRAVLAKVAEIDRAKPAPAAAIRTIDDATVRLQTARAAEAEAEASIAELRRELSRLYDFSAQWRQAIDGVKATATMQAEAAEDRKLEISERLRQLSNATLAAARIHREIAGVARYNASDAGQTLPLDRVMVSLDGLPEACRPGETEAPGRICNPSPDRVRATLAAVFASPPESLAKSIDRAIWALEAYIRAGELRFSDLSATLTDEIVDGQQTLTTLATADRIQGGLVRLNQVLGDTDTLLDTLRAAGHAPLHEIDAQLRGLFWQATFRARGTARAIPGIRFDGAELDTALAAMRDHWAVTLAELQRKRAARLAFATDMTNLSDELAQLEARIRADAGVWVNAMVTATVAALTLLVAGSIGLLWRGQSLITRPLTETTTTILALSRGEAIGPVRLSRRALGFDRLERALERLRLANIERSELTRKTLAQRAEIESNLETIAEAMRVMEHQARHDALTGLPNRRYADEYVAALGGTLAGRGGGTQRGFTFLHLDVDRFKEINDTLGHEAGDAILRHVAAILEDLVAPEDFVFRIGGDEFLIVREGDASDDAAAVLASRIIEAMNRPVDHRGHACRVGASLGIAHGRDGAFDGPRTLVNADIALYEAKNSGRNRYVFFTAALQEKRVQRKQLADQLLHAIEHAEFVPVYQPQFFSHTLGLRGLEVLCRWQHPQLGLLGPADFLADAEDANLLGRIDQILLRKAAEDLEYFRSRAVSVPKISFNVTADRLMHAGFAQTLVQAIGGETEIAIELLESMSLDSLSETVRWAIDSLKEHGVGIEIDDFGSCRASIAGLIAVGPDALKIDGSIVSPITSSEQHLRLVRAIVDIGDALGIEVIAERVETEEHIRILRDCRCAVLQGYALARPMRAADLVGFLSARAQGKALSA